MSGYRFIFLHHNTVETDFVTLNNLTDRNQLLLIKNTQQFEARIDTITNPFHVKATSQSSIFPQMMLHVELRKACHKRETTLTKRDGWSKKSFKYLNAHIHQRWITN